MAISINTLYEHNLIVSNLVYKLPTIQAVSNLIVKAYERGNKVVICGNGGSAVDAEHFVTELVSKFYLNRKGLNAVCLTSNPATLTAIGNDFDFNEIFSRQVVACAMPNDVVIGLSTSGKSQNVLNALNTAKEINAIPIFICGECNSPYDHTIMIDSTNTPRVQEAYLLVLHMIAEEVERRLFNEESGFP